MPEVIAATYEIIKQIGAGGGGVVYLGRHLRLDKLIVLKADKRSLTTKPEVLQREVNALKNLTHTYIPQVYDFVQENGVVYTVMDYIQGESLDKPLERNETFALPQIVEWGCELLEALAYLHNRPPHGILHSDIKPANIMVTPDHTIRLIDFNIALILKQEGAVRVGRSRGYASPEHYGVDFTDPDVSAALLGTTATATRSMTGRGRTSSSVSSSISSPSTGSTTSGRKTVLLDKRSDIYSVGATLYHLLTGVRPAQRAEEVIPASTFPVNSVVAAVIEKAMHPNPDLRYQSAEEMLYALEHLHERDPRTGRHKRHMIEAAALTAAVLTAGAALTYIGLRQSERLQSYLNAASESVTKLQENDVNGAITSALKALPENPGLFDPPEYLPEAQLALTNALGVYDLRGEYRPWKRISLPGNPKKIRISPDGTKAAVLVQNNSTWFFQIFDLETGKKLAEPEAQPYAISDMIFRDNNTLLYTGLDGLSAWDLSDASAQGPLWTTGQPATSIALSDSGAMIATVWRDDQQAFFFDPFTGQPVHAPVSFDGKQMRMPEFNLEDPQFNLFALDETGRYLAVSFSDGSVSIYDLLDNTVLASTEPSEFTHIQGAFCGEYLALSFFRSGTVTSGEISTLFEIFDLADPEMPCVFGPMTGQENHAERYSVQCADGMFYLSNRKQLARIDMDTQTSTLLVSLYDSEETIADFCHMTDRTVIWTGSETYRIYNDAGQLVEQGSADETGTRIDRAAVGGEFFVCGNTDQPFLSVRRLENHTDALFFKYDPSYTHDEARLRSDGEAVILFGYENFRIVHADGTITDGPALDAANVYDPRYRRPGDTDFLGRAVTEDMLEILYLDGHVESYSAITGKLIRQDQRTPPTPNAMEDILTKDYRIVCEDFNQPEVYSLENDTLLKKFDDITSLWYATQVENKLIFQYSTMEADQESMIVHGLILDENLNAVAAMRDLSDILPDGTLIFDDTLGNLRQSRIYSIKELTAMAKQQTGNSE